MSFSSNIKEELSRNETGARHCKIAEIAGFLRFGGNISLEPEHYKIQIQTETVSAAKRFYKLIKDVFDIHAKIDVGRNEFLKRSRNYTISVDKHKDCVLILKAVKLLDSKEFGLVLQNTCCKRAYIRGAFQAAGSMSDPEKNYHFEIACISSEKAAQIKELFEFFEKYNFTVDESAPFDIEISIDPEMLGRIFENLLAEINPESSASTRKETGSFYTPREIVDYMVCESIKLYLYKKTQNVKADKIDNIFSVNEEADFSNEERNEILNAIHEMKILDIACGSGAFPMGILNRVFNIIDKLDFNHEFYKEFLLKNIKGQAREEFKKLYQANKFNYAYIEK